MLQLKLKDPYEAVFVGLRLENPSTGESTIVDAKIDTGATVTLVPMSMVNDLALEVIGEADFAAANGGIIHTYIAHVKASLSDDDTFDVPIYIHKSEREVAFVGMDILQLCNYAQWHEGVGQEHSIFFKIESVEM